MLRTGTGRLVSIGLLPNMAPQLIPGALAWLREAGRAVQLNVREDTLDRMLAQAQRHELDLLVCRLDASALSAGLDVAPLYRDDMIVVAAPSAAQARADRLARRGRVPVDRAAARVARAHGAGRRVRECGLAATARPNGIGVMADQPHGGRAVALPVQQSARAFELAVRAGSGSAGCR